MIVGIMQPYFFPYIGYWQLIHAVDKYVVYDDVNYIKRGWINRNRILIDKKPMYINLPVLGASQNKLINEVDVDNTSTLIKKNLRKISHSYAGAPYFKNAYPIIEKILTCKKDKVSSYIEYSFEIILEYLAIDTKIIISSQIAKDNTLKGEDKIIEICKLLSADEYYNAIGGQCLYSDLRFRKEGIELKFLKTKDIFYKQYGDIFYPNLSIIDVMMFNEKKIIQEMLNSYELIKEP